MPFSEYKSANSDCLWKALQSALDESDIPHTDINLKEVMDPWIKQKGYPLIYVTRDYSAGTMTLVQKDFRLIDAQSHEDDNEDKDEDDQRAWWVPINYATESKPDFASVRPTNWLKPNDNLTIDGISADDWVIVNTQQSGNYNDIELHNSYIRKKLLKVYKSIEGQFLNFHMQRSLCIMITRNTDTRELLDSHSELLLNYQQFLVFKLHTKPNRINCKINFLVT